MTADGRCECGAVRYRLTAEPLVVNCCHCRDCQRITGSAFALNAMIETDRIEVIEGSPHEQSLCREGQGDTRSWRCPACATLLWADHPTVGDALRFVRVGTLDANERFPPDAHFFVRSKHPWIVVPAGAPQFETLPEDGLGVELPPGRAARLRGARSASETTPG